MEADFVDKPRQIRPTRHRLTRTAWINRSAHRAKDCRGSQSCQSLNAGEVNCAALHSIVDLGLATGLYLSMSETSLLSGKVTRQSLPILQPPTAPGSPVLKRLKLPQGELAQFYDGEPGIQYIAYIELLPGNPRGNHYHNG